MTLAKLKIKPQSPSKLDEITVLFNPTSYSITKPVTWRSPNPKGEEDRKELEGRRRSLNAPILEFGGGGSRVLTLQLFFDVTEPINREGQTILIDDVRQETDKIVKLTRIERDADPQQPPICEVSWGGKPLENPNFPFIGVVTNLVQNFTLFKSDGKPLRANLTVTFTESINEEKDRNQTDPEQTTRIIKRGDTLSSITAEVYSDPTLWRIIAETNRLDDPRHLEIGKPLNIPKLR